MKVLSNFLYVQYDLSQLKNVLKGKNWTSWYAVDRNPFANAGDMDLIPRPGKRSPDNTTKGSPCLLQLEKATKDLVQPKIKLISKFLKRKKLF